MKRCYLSPLSRSLSLSLSFSLLFSFFLTRTLDEQIAFAFVLILSNLEICGGYGITAFGLVLSIIEIILLVLPVILNHAFWIT